MAHGKTTAPPKNSLGAIVYTDNPFIYKAGAILEATNVHDNLNLRVNPLGTYQLFDENILICGLPIELFEGKVNPVVLTYTRSAPRMVDGVACHQLVRVDNMEKAQ